jgi:hypothetical protein
MPTFLFLQRFENGQPVPVPFAKAIAVLERYGKAGRGRGDLEFTFEPETIAFGCTVVGNQEAGAVCIGFERPRYDEALRKVAWDCMQALDCAAFNDTLDSVYVLPGRARALPSAWGALGSDITRQTTRAQQLWPSELETAVEGRAVPAARYTNPNPNGPNLQIFDHDSSSPQALTIEFGMRPAACNPGTLRILRNLELRVAAAIRTNPEHALCYRFTHHETALLFMESSRLLQDRVPATILTTPPPFETAPTGAGFIANRAVFNAVENTSDKFVESVRQHYRLELDGSFDSIDTLSKVLDAAHELDQQERRTAPAGEYASKTVMSLSVRAGAYLGRIIQRLVGGQWGYIARPDSRRRPAIRMHNGQVRYPHLQVLDHIINGRSDDVAAWARAVATTDRSATPRQEDIVGNIPLFCSILLGAARFADGGLPLEAQIPRAALNFSVDSLRQLDAYIAQVAAQTATLSQQDISNLFFVAGAYLGEVVRSNTADPTRWTWVNYDDFVAANPEFREKRPREFGFLAFLDSPTNTAYPFAQVAGLLRGAQLPPSHVFAMQLIGATAAPTTPTPTTPARSAPSEDSAMKQALTHVREALAKWRRVATPSDFLGLRAPGPSWIRTHALNEIVTHQPLLLQKGEVVWGAVLQANNALFKPGPNDHPGAVVYGRDPYFDSRPHELGAIASKLFSYKDTQAPEAFRPISDWLTNERETAFNLPVPPALTEHPAFATAVLFFRKHLPEQWLAGSWMPLLVHSETRAVMVVPRQFWPRAFVTRWTARNLQVKS